MPKAKQKTKSVEEEGDLEEGHDLHRVINPLEAKSHIDNLDQIMAMIQERVDSGNTNDLAETVIERIKMTLANTLPMMQEADISTVVKVVKDRSFEGLLPRSNKVDQMLEILPTEEVPRAMDLIQAVEAEEPLAESDQMQMAKLFKTLEVVHD